MDQQSEDEAVKLDFLGDSPLSQEENNENSEIREYRQQPEEEQFDEDEEQIENDGKESVLDMDTFTKEPVIKREAKESPQNDVFPHKIMRNPFFRRMRRASANRLF